MVVLMSRTVLYDLPPSIRGFIREDENGETVYIINSRLTREANIKTYLHEKSHYEHNDLQSLRAVAEIEKERHY